MFLNVIYGSPSRNLAGMMRGSVANGGDQVAVLGVVEMVGKLSESEWSSHESEGGIDSCVSLRLSFWAAGS